MSDHTPDDKSPLTLPEIHQWKNVGDLRLRNKMEQALTGGAKHERKLDAWQWVIKSYPEAYNSHRYSADMIELTLRRLKWNIQQDDS